MKKRRWTEAEDAAMCLGMVVLPKSGRIQEALAVLSADDEIEVGTVQGNRIPICAFTTIAEDRDLLTRIESLSSILSVNVVYAETLTEETA